MAVTWAKRKVNSTAAKRKPTLVDRSEKTLPSAVDARVRKAHDPKPAVAAKTPYKVAGSHTFSDLLGADKSGLAQDPGPIRLSTRLDLQRDVCKQFFQTGRCRYGDSCKFSHERGDSRPLRQREKSWEVGVRKVGRDAKHGTSDVCAICSKSPSVPLKVQCGHVCCESCYTTAVKQSPSTACGVCDQQLGSSAEFL